MKYTKLLKKISAINKLVLESRSLKDEKKIIQKIVDAARNTLEADYAYAFWWNKNSKKFELSYKDKDTPFTSKTPRKQGTTAKAFEQRSPIFIDHATKIPGIRDDAKKFMKGVVIIPIIYKKDKYGVIDICFYKTHIFTNEEKVLCEYIGNSAAQVFTIKKAEQYMIKLMQQKDEFFNIASHELKTPITTIKGFAQILKNKFEGSDLKTKYFVEKINNQVEKLEHLINDLLDISRIETGKIKFEKKDFELSSLIEKVIEDMKINIFNHPISFKANGKFWINGDYERIERALINLINNASKYSPPGSKIKIYLKEKGGNAFVEVEDFGHGIDEKDRSKIFNRFFQSKRHIKKSYSGLGLGLHITKEIIEHHRGNVDFVSKKDSNGTIFFFTLPYKNEI